eukprot:1140853-Pelagomonas_calceolata.AAC.12
MPWKEACPSFSPAAAEASQVIRSTHQADIHALLFIFLWHAGHGTSTLPHSLPSQWSCWPTLPLCCVKMPALNTVSLPLHHHHDGAASTGMFCDSMVHLKIDMECFNTYIWYEKCSGKSALKPHPKLFPRHQESEVSFKSSACFCYAEYSHCTAVAKLP